MKLTSASSSQTVTPSFWAFSSLLPAPGPATTMPVFLLTLSLTVAPFSSSHSLSWSRVAKLIVPVSTTVLP